MEELTSFAALVALTIGLTEVLKRIGIPKKFLPLVSLTIGFGLNFVGSSFALTPLSILAGIAIGLSASGLYDHKAILGKT